ncbi:phosphatase PAP2 family protein [[Acholeplasma] multilocale]|uniref:phosphatase PAP2 family protein n=1 Tax=[Acholeplasma] multilocale TaxID=264638 RepID=UPI000479903D|nr:phosphatase PAP2 family protein [[Acholeplasma] multilocale]
MNDLISKKYKKSLNTKNIIKYTFLGFLLFALATLIATSWYSVDNWISATAYKAMDYKFFRIITAVFIIEGQTNFSTYLGILLVIIYQRIVKYFASNKEMIDSHYHRAFKIGENIFALFLYAFLFYVVISLNMYFWNWPVNGNFGFQDMELGGVHYEHFIGRNIMNPIRIWSITANSIIIVSVSAFIRFKVSKRENFISDNIATKALIIICTFVLSNHLVNFVLKPGFWRPRWMNVNFGYVLEKVKDWSPEGYEYYINQNYYHYGFTIYNDNGEPIRHWMATTTTGNTPFSNAPVGSKWQWWKISGGSWGIAPPNMGILFDKPYDAFPSGHTNAGLLMVFTSVLLINHDEKNKYKNTAQWTFVSCIVFYLLGLIFSMLITSGHWWSDMMFTVVMFSALFFIFNFSIKYLFGLFSGIDPYALIFPKKEKILPNKRRKSYVDEVVRINILINHVKENRQKWREADKKVKHIWNHSLVIWTLMSRRIKPLWNYYSLLFKLRKDHGITKREL